MLLLGLLLGCRTPPGTPQPYVATDGAMAGATVDEIAVAVSALRSDAGTVRCFLYDAPDGFPEAHTHVVAEAIALPATRAATCRFKGVARARDYAVVITHDENNDAVFQTGAFGIPLEGYGFSNNVRPQLSAPSFADCKVHYDAGHDGLAIAMQY
jgi:uncharacterized protein (DUF2141 family)